MSGTIKTFRDLIVWQKSMTLVTDVYRASSAFPTSEQYGLTSQLRRCAVSIPSNIAEGFGRDSTNDYLRFLSIANGSLYESQTQLEIARNLDFLHALQFDQLLEQSREIERMLSSLMRRLKEQRGKVAEGQREKAKGQRSIGPEGQRE
jgi:four helix bundle protein